MASERRAARRTGLVVGLTIAMLVAAGAMLSITHSNSAAKQQRLVVNNFETISLMRQALIVLQDAEIGERAYTLSGDTGDLDSYERARLRIDTMVRQLDASTAGDADAMAQIAEFRIHATEKLDELNAEVMAHQREGGGNALPSAAVPSAAGRLTTERLRRVAEAFVEGQRLLLTRRLDMLRSEQEQADTAGLLVLGGAFFCLIASMWIIVGGARRLEQAQDQLSARTRLLQETMETLQSPIFVLDATGHVVAWNELFARLADWDPMRQVRPTREQLLSLQSPVTRALFTPLKLEEPASGDVQTVRVAHDGRDYEVSRGRMSDGGAVVSAVDITDKLRDETALRQGQKMEAVGQLTGGLAHDFNNILQIVQANLDLVKGEVPFDAQALGRLNSVSAAAERGARLTQQLLAFARRQPLAPRPTDIGRLVSDLTDLLGHALGERITIDFVVTPDAWNARIDPGQLENAILNLAINARDAMPEGGHVTVEVSNATLDRRYAALHPDVTPGAYVMIAVDDTGTGMPADVVARAFDPFFTTKQDGKGTGLGLSMVYGFVRQSNGHIRIDSAIGQGTSVKLYLPRTIDPIAEEEADTSGASIGSERILVVEDNDEVRRAVVDMLSGWGYRVVAAENPDAAAALLQRDPAFDLLFTDVVMPGPISTMELAALAQRVRPNIAVLLTSGYARDLIPRQDGPDYPMITKPYRAEELATRIRSVLASRRVQATPAALSTAPTKAKQPRRVLLVEDEVVLRMSTVDMLERLNCFVAAAGSGEQALEMLERNAPFDLLLTDLGLPGMSGDELATEAMRRYPGMKVVIASGYGSDKPRADGVHFIGKPYSAIDLEQALGQAPRSD